MTVPLRVGETGAETGTCPTSHLDGMHHKTKSCEQLQMVKLRS